MVPKTQQDEVNKLRSMIRELDAQYSNLQQEIKNKLRDMESIDKKSYV